MPDGRADRHHRPGPDGRHDGLVRRTAWAGGDRDHPDPGDRTGVRDGSGGGSEDGLAGGAGEIQPAMAWQPWLGGVLEAVDDGRAGSERPGGRRGAGSRSEDGRQGEDQAAKIHTWKNAVGTADSGRRVAACGQPVPGSLPAGSVP
ncbi:hypothetical protein OG474_02100 [Kribbella sp. NBC_01505]